MYLSQPVVGSGQSRGGGGCAGRRPRVRGCCLPACPRPAGCPAAAELGGGCAGVCVRGGGGCWAARGFGERGRAGGSRRGGSLREGPARRAGRLRGLGAFGPMLKPVTKAFRDIPPPAPWVSRMLAKGIPYPCVCGGKVPREEGRKEMGSDLPK